MKSYSLSHLSDQTLLHGLASLVARDRSTTADLLAHIAEVDARKLYAPAGYPSMYAYCVEVLHLSEEAAYKRIHAARASRLYPAIFQAVADGRLHLSAIVLLAPHLGPGNADALLEAATHKTKSQIQQLIADRFPRADVPAFVRPIAQPALVSPSSEHAPGRVESSPPRAGTPVSQEPTPTISNAPDPVQRSESRARVEPLAPQRYAVQFTMDQDLHELLQKACDLLGPEVKREDIAHVFKRAMQLLVSHLEKKKSGVTDRPRRRSSLGNGRYIPAEIRRAVWKRDGGRCTFVGDSGRRCQERHALEFDHVHEFARGGLSTVANLRLRCRTHNQYVAEQSLGAGFMRLKRLDARASRDIRTVVARAL